MKDKLLTVEAHLCEARRRIIASLVLWGIIFGIEFCFSEKMLGALIWAFGRAGLNVSMLSPTDIFVCEAEISAVISVLLSLPVFLYHIVAYFELPIPKKVLTITYLAFAFGGGVFMCILLPVVVDIMSVISDRLCINSEITLLNALNLCISVFVAGGLVLASFVCAMFLINKHMLKRDVLSKARPIVYIAVLVFSALFSPPDVLSMLLLACPIILLYELCAFISKKAERRRRK